MRVKAQLCRAVCLIAAAWEGGGGGGEARIVSQYLLLY